MLYLEAFNNGSLGPIINKGIIKLIPKGKNEDSIAGWHPITLLNTSYKIITKTLAIRIKPIVQMIVRAEQTGFLKGKYILDNLMLAWETAEWAQQSGQNALIVKLDFHKAYDRIRWSFILKMLQWLGFGPKILKHVQMLFQDANVHLIINKNMSESFVLQRSIRQGCPLSPFLYVLTADALGYFLHKAHQMKLIKGISIPQDKVAINSHFVDDSMLFLHNSEEEVNNALAMIQLYCEVFGSLIAHNKTEFLMTQPYSNSQWIPKEWRKIRHGEITRYLGIPFGLGVSLSEMWTWFLNRIKHKLFSFGNKFMSLAGKIQVANKILIASMCVLFFLLDAFQARL